MKKIISVVLAFILLLLSFSTAYPSFAATYPYIDENGLYHRVSFGTDVAFKCDYDYMIDEMAKAVSNRDITFTYNDNDYFNFATQDEKYRYIDSYGTKENGESVLSIIENDIKESLASRFRISDVDTGDYFLSNVNMVVSVQPFSPDGDSAFVQDGVSYKFATFRIYVDFSYNTTVLQDSYIADMVEEISAVYVEPCKTSYDKIKTIYDFVVRNCNYDYDVYTNENKEYPQGSQRFNIAHSAYGALCGSLLKDAGQDSDLNLNYKRSITGEHIVYEYDQGLAVCEGFSKLFYYLCVYNGIPCHITDGDYCSKSGKVSDPHEWNMVYIKDDNNDGWFLVDTTFAERNSYKIVDLNNYDYFLRGYENIKFGYLNHQQPYVNSEFYKNEYRPYSERRIARYDWYSLMSPVDYNFAPVNLQNTLMADNDNTVIIRRDSIYEEGSTPKSTFIKTNILNTNRIEYDEEDGFIPKEKVEGFTYNGVESKYNLSIPYLLDCEYELNGDVGDKRECGTYKMKLFGSNNTEFTTQFKIIPLDMSNDKPGNYTVKVNHTDFKGEAIKVTINIVDKYKHQLYDLNADNPDDDYDVMYTDGAGNAVSEIANIGSYYIYISFKGNHTGVYKTILEVQKIKLSTISDQKLNLSYVPKYIRIKNNINDADVYVKKSAKSFVLGKMVLNQGVDYTITATGGLDYGDTGTITMSGIESSSVLMGGYPKTIKYEINGKYDLSCIDIENLGTLGVYSGKEIKPAKIEALDKILTPGVDYEIVSYGKNLVNAGYNTVTIRGINGCSGEKTIKYHIACASITNADITTSVVDGKLNYSISYNGKKLVKGTDYNETITNTATGYIVSLTGIGNFAGTANIKIENAGVSSGNTQLAKIAEVKLSKTSYTYDGKVKKPSVIIKDTNGKALSTKYYSVSYASGRKNVGKYAVKITFKGKYSGSKTLYFTIKPKGTSISSVTASSKGFTVKWKKQTTQTSGYQIQYSTSSKFSNPYSVTVSKNTTASKKISKLKAKKKYYVRIRTYKTVSGTKYYSAWSSYKSVTTKK